MNKGNNSVKRKENWKSKWYNFYSHIGIYVKISASYVKDVLCRAITDKQTHTKTYIQSKHSLAFSL